MRGVVSEERDDFVALDPEGDFLVAHRPARRLVQHRRERHDRHDLLRARRAARRARRTAHFLQPGRASARPASSSTGRTSIRLHDRRRACRSRPSTLNADSTGSRKRRVEMPPKTRTSSRSTPRTPGTGRSRSAPMSRTCLEGEEGPRGRNFNMRWVASMVADVYRMLSRGGVYLYPEERARATATAGCVCSTRRTRSPSSSSRPAARRSTAIAAFSTIEPTSASTRARR